MIRDLIESVAGYPGLFAFCAMSGFLVPLPEDFSLLYAGTRIASGDWAWLPTLAVATSGVLVRDLIAWLVGRVFGGWLLHRAWIRRLLGDGKLTRAQGLVSRHGALAVFMGRFLIGFRAPVFMAAGAMGVSVKAFAFWDLLGLVIAVPMMVGLGFAFGEPIADLVFWGLQRARLVVLFAVVVGAGWLWWRMRQGAQTEPSGAPSE